MAETSATPAATRTPVAMELTKALCAPATSALPCGPPRCRPMTSAAATELVAACTTGPGACAAASVLPSRDRYTAAERLPTIATPRAPPTSLMVSLMALPAPAWCAGTVVMMVVLAGAMTRPMPAPMIAMAMAIGG